MQQTILIILDGWGISRELKGNAIAQAKTPTIDSLKSFYPVIPLQASGIAIGLPWDEAGNSEVGHLTLGSGRTIYQSLPRISLSIKDGSFFKNPVLLQAIKHSQENNSCLHLMGLASSGSVHSYIDHLQALIELAKREGIAKVRLHLFTDGEDGPAKEALTFFDDIEKRLSELKDGKIATVIGRIFSMDRNKNWDKTQKAYECLVNSKGFLGEKASAEIEKSYQKDITDTFIEPIVLTDSNKQPLGAIEDGDSVVFFNFRKDRALQLTQAFSLPNFKEFPTKQFKKLFFATMIQHEEGLTAQVLFPPIKTASHLTEILGTHDKKVLKIAETEKYAHVTYFFNGGIEEKFPNEERALISSAFSTNYDESPQMAASQITERIIQAINQGTTDLIVANYANADIIGHTGNLQAAIKAIESVDAALKPLIDSAVAKKCNLLITADHGNAEQMLDLRTGEPYPEHTTNPVPCFLITPENKKERSKSVMENNFYQSPQGILSDIAPTILELMKIPKPPVMTGQSLLKTLLTLS